MWGTSHTTARTPQVPYGLSPCPALQCRQGGDSGVSAALSFPVQSVPHWHTETGELMSDKATPLDEPGQFVPGNQW